MSSALVQLTAKAARLQPEIRLAQAVSDFGARLKDDHKTVFKTLRTQRPPTESDVIKLTEEVNLDGSRLHGKSWRPHGVRLLCLLDQIQAVCTAGDVLVGGAQNILASGVWATVRIVLQLVVGYLSFFDKLSVLFMRLGKSSAIQRDLVQLFPDCKELRDLLCEYLIVVVRFCQKLVAYESKGLVSQLVHALAVNKVFEDFEKELGGWAALINQKVNLLVTESQLETRSSLVKIRHNLALALSDLDRERRLQILNHLSPHQAELESVWRRERKRGSVGWIFKEDGYVRWKTSQTPEALLVTGSLGSGKTVLMANVVGELHANREPETRAIVGSFFCQSGNRKTLESNVLMGSLAHQIVRVLDDHAAAKAVQRFHRDYWLEVDAASVVKYLKEVLPKKRRYFAVVDALDECSVENAAQVLESIKSLQQVIPLYPCFSVRTDSPIKATIEALFPEAQHASMSNSQKLTEIAEFIDSELQRRSSIRSLSPELEEKVKQALIAGAQGMYLWVVLQIEHILPKYHATVTSDGDIASMLDNMPPGLYQAYEQALERISDRRYGSRIFELVASATRPLTVDELRVALNVKLGMPIWDNSKVATDGSVVVYRCGGGLLEIDEEDTSVWFIHHSALQHLLETETNGAVTDTMRFGLTDAEIFLALTCITYLNLDIHERRVAIRRTVAIDAERTTGRIGDTVSLQGGRMAKLMKRCLERKQPQTTKLDLAKIIREIGTAEPVHNNATGNDIFLAYAKSSWLHHSRVVLFAPGEHKDCHELFLRILHHNPRQAKLPWSDDTDKAGMIQWAVHNDHCGIFSALLRRD